MNKIIYTFVILFISQLNFANGLDSILSKARELGKNKNYTEAIKAYESYIKNAGDINLKEVYIEIANCYFLVEKKEVAVKYIKKAITKYGFNEDDFIYSNTLNEDLSKYALSLIYDNYFDLRAQYLSTVK
jgi:tetratricopeptide (TPR) repeat protein